MGNGKRGKMKIRSAYLTGRKGAQDPLDAEALRARREVLDRIGFNATARCGFFAGEIASALWKWMLRQVKAGHIHREDGTGPIALEAKLGL